MQPHGTVTRYTNNKCRCPSCTAAWSLYMNKWKARGGKGWGDLRTVRRHLRFLLDTSRPTKERFSVRGLARHLGMDYMALHNIHNGKTKRITKPTADLILATSLYDLDSARSWRRKCPTNSPSTPAI